jgi:RHS repeat-associated protein
MQMEERTFAATDYRYGFNGQEQDGELMDGAVVFKYRVHDPRIGKFLSVDPLAKQYSFISTYCFAANSPILYIDADGGAPKPTIYAATDKVFMLYLTNYKTISTSTSLFEMALMAANNTSPKEFERWALGRATDSGAKNKVLGAYGEGHAAFHLVKTYYDGMESKFRNGEVIDKKSIDIATNKMISGLSFQQKNELNDKATPDITWTFRTYKIKKIIDVEVDHSFFAIDGEVYSYEFDSYLPWSWKLQYEVKTISPTNRLATNFGYIKTGIGQVEYRLSQEVPIFGYDLQGVLVLDYDAYMNLYNANPEIDGVEFRTMMKGYLDKSGQFLYLIKNLHSDSNKAIHSAKDKVAKGVKDSRYKKKK